MFKHSRKDACLVALAILQVVLVLLPFFHSFQIPVIFALGLMCIFLIGTNYQCVAHNFLHLPFFQSQTLNRCFSFLNTLAIGLPQSGYRIHHLHHHRFNNHPELDESSTYRHGKDGREENIVCYSFLGIFRVDTLGYIQKAGIQSHQEITFLLIFLGFLATLNWKLFLGYVLPVYFLGQVFALWENYCEHHHANPHDRKRDSVSCYNSFYNWIWFNNGYHQEHHFAPQVHWTKIPEVRASLPEDRVIVKGCHLTNSF